MGRETLLAWNVYPSPLSTCHSGPSGLAIHITVLNSAGIHQTADENWSWQKMMESGFVSLAPGVLVQLPAHGEVVRQKLCGITMTSMMVNTK